MKYILLILALLKIFNFGVLIIVLIRMLNDPLPLAILDQSNEKKIITRVAHDWNEVEVRCISEILQSFEVIILRYVSGC